MTAPDSDEFSSSGVDNISLLSIFIRFAMSLCLNKCVIGFLMCIASSCWSISATVSTTGRHWFFMFFYIDSEPGNHGLLFKFWLVIYYWLRLNLRRIGLKRGFLFGVFQSCTALFLHLPPLLSLSQSLCLCLSFSISLLISLFPSLSLDPLLPHVFLSLHVFFSSGVKIFYNYNYFCVDIRHLQLAQSEITPHRSLESCRID